MIGKKQNKHKKQIEYGEKTCFFVNFSNVLSKKSTIRWFGGFLRSLHLLRLRSHCEADKRTLGLTKFDGKSFKIDGKSTKSNKLLHKWWYIYPFLQLGGFHKRDSFTEFFAIRAVQQRQHPGGATVERTLQKRLKNKSNFDQ